MQVHSVVPVCLNFQPVPVPFVCAFMLVLLDHADSEKEVETQYLNFRIER